MSLDIEKKILQLRKDLHQHNHNYYVLDNPQISDYEFDIMLKELQELEKKHPYLYDKNSPTQRVGDGVSKKFQTVLHNNRMYSLDNSYSKVDIEQWIARVYKIIQTHKLTYICEPKYDGVSISLIYENGKLIRAVTRGDGIQGDDVTANVRTIKSIPLILREDILSNNNNTTTTIEVRGEIIMSLDSFWKLNEMRKSRGEEMYMNPRNTASGSLKLLHSEEVAKRNLECIAYGAILSENKQQYDTHIKILKGLKQCGFKVASNLKESESIQEIMYQIDEIEKQRTQMAYQIDGVVIKVNELLYQEELGYTSKFPRWAIAYKFKTERVSTILKDVSYQVGRTGAITPIAELEPILLGGTLVKRASLHNSDFIKKMNLYREDTVYVEKGGEIIPKIVGVNLEKRKQNALPINYITHCLECNTLLQKLEKEAQHYCTNYQCPSQIYGRIRHFVSRKAMDIEGLGGETIQLLHQQGLIKDVSDLYTLTEDKLIYLERMAEKSASNLLKAIDISKNKPLEKVLYALGIRYVGETVAKKLAQSFHTIDDLMNANEEQMASIDDVGTKIAKSVVYFFEQQYNVDIITKLKEHGISFISEENKQVSSKLKGMTFVISGTFQDYSREELKEKIINNSGKIASSISSKVSYLIAGEKAGSSKLTKANQLGIETINEKTLKAKFL